MRTRTLIGLATVVFALAVAAVPAMAHQFVGSKTGTLTGKGSEEIEKVEKGEFREYNPAQMQQWKFGIFNINCYSEKSSGTLAETSVETLELTLKFTACAWYPKPTIDLHQGASFPKEGIKVRFHANGFVELLENGEEVEFKGEILPGAAAVKVNGKICHIEIPAQTIPVKAIKHPEEEFSTVLYSNTIFHANKSAEFPTEEQQAILFTNSWKPIKFKFGGEEQQCTNPEGFEKDAEEGATSGKYVGKFYVKLKGGNLRYE